MTLGETLRLSERLSLLFPQRIWSVLDSSSNAFVRLPQRDNTLQMVCLIKLKISLLRLSERLFLRGSSLFPSKNLECCRLFPLRSGYRATPDTVVECRCYPESFRNSERQHLTADQSLHIYAIYLLPLLSFLPDFRPGNKVQA